MPKQNFTTNSNPSTSLTHPTQATGPSPIVPLTDGKDAAYRVRKYNAHLDATGTPWYKPDLAAYRDKLLADGLARSTTGTHLSTIRACYKAITRDRDRFYTIASAELERLGLEDNLVNRKATVDEIITRLVNATDPAAAPCKAPIIQDQADSDFIRLTKDQAAFLMKAPGTDTLIGLRDTSLICLALCTGLREGELAALDVSDLRQRLTGELAIRVREGKGAKQRLVPYGALEWALAIVDRWLDVAGITGGAVFRSFRRGGVLRGRLSTRGIQVIAGKYRVMIDGESRKVKPHDWRRSYARRLYEEGLDLVAIQQNLGHASQQTTLTYIGTLSADQRKPPMAWDPVTVSNGQGRLL